jgi:hypothetical protein
MPVTLGFLVKVDAQTCMPNIVLMPNIVCVCVVSLQAQANSFQMLMPLALPAPEAAGYGGMPAPGYVPAAGFTGAPGYGGY